MLGFEAVHAPLYREMSSGASCRVTADGLSVPTNVQDRSSADPSAVNVKVCFDPTSLLLDPDSGSAESRTGKNRQSRCSIVQLRPQQLQQLLTIKDKRFLKAAAANGCCGPTISGAA